MTEGRRQREDNTQKAVGRRQITKNGRYREQANGGEDREFS